MRYLPNGFKIFYDGQKAFYLEFLQEGTKYSSEHKGFIDMTATAISAHITAALNGHTNNLNATRKKIRTMGRRYTTKTRRFSRQFSQNKR